MRRDRQRGRQRDVRRGLRLVTAAGCGLAAVASGGLAAVAPAAAYAGHGRDADQSICGAVVTADVTLHHDVSCPGNGPTVTTPGVTIDLGGHTLSGTDGAGRGISVQNVANETPVRIVNGTIAGFSTGISADSSLAMSRVRVHDTDTGLWSASSYGGCALTIEGGTFDHNVTGVQIILCPLTATRDQWVGNETGLFLWNSSSPARVTGSVFRDNGYGVAGKQVNDVVLSKNRFTGNDSAVYLHQCAHDRVIDNLVDHNGSGVWIHGVVSPDAVVSGNRFLDNETYGARMGNGYEDTMEGTQVSDNLFRGNGAAGLWFDAAPVADGSTITDNLFVGNGYDPHGVDDEKGAPLDDGLHAWVPATAGTVTLTGNRAVHNAGHGIEAAIVVDGGGNVEVANGAGDGFPTPTP